MKKIVSTLLLLLFMATPIIHGQEKNTPDEVIIEGVPLICQHPEMPNGCELVAATMMLNYYGIKATKLEVAKAVTRATGFSRSKSGKLLGGSPTEGFVGNPTGSSGIGALAEPILALIETYMPNQSINLSGQPFESLLKEVAAGHPVVVWATLDFGSPGSTFDWYLSNGTKIKWPRNSHTVTLIGFSEKEVIINNPTTGKVQRVDLTRFKNSYIARGSYAVSAALPTLTTPLTKHVDFLNKLSISQIKTTPLAKPTPLRMVIKHKTNQLDAKQLLLSAGQIYVNKASVEPFLSTTLYKTLQFEPVTKLYQLKTVFITPNYYVFGKNQKTPIAIYQYNGQDYVPLLPLLKGLGYSYDQIMVNGTAIWTLK